MTDMLVKTLLNTFNHKNNICVIVEKFLKYHNSKILILVRDKSIQEHIFVQYLKYKFKIGDK